MKKNIIFITIIIVLLGFIITTQSKTSKENIGNLVSVTFGSKDDYVLWYYNKTTGNTVAVKATLTKNSYPEPLFIMHEETSVPLRKGNIPGPRRYK